jgi:hypothetical protein
MKRLNGKLVSKYRDQTWGLSIRGFWIICFLRTQGTSGEKQPEMINIRFLLRFFPIYLNWKGQGGFFISIKVDKNFDLFKYGIGCDKF